MEKIPDRIDSKFRYVLVAATRCEQLMRGAPPKLDYRSGKLTKLALKEVIQDVVPWDYGPAPLPDPEAESAAGEPAASKETSD
jgi:DNA-directed RNA polymerase subunit K/omega